MPKDTITKTEVRELLGDAERYAVGTEYAVIRSLPRTPGRDTVEEGVALVRRGIATIKKEAELA
jgi:hypothetical protein